MDEKVATLWGVIDGRPYWRIQIMRVEFEAFVSEVVEGDELSPHWFVVLEDFDDTDDVQIAITHPEYFAWTKKPIQKGDDQEPQ